MHRLGTVALRGLIPSLLLPAVTWGAAILGAQLHPSSGDFGGGIFVLVVVVYLFVLLGSMTLNVWLLLRHPATFATGALPERVAALLIALWALLVVWSGLMLLGFDEAGIVVAVAVALLSIVVCVLAIARHRDAVPRVAEFTLSRGVRAAALTYFVAAILALGYAVASAFIGPGLDTGGAPLGGPETWIMLVLGLPWSWPLYLATLVGQAALNSNGPILYVLAPAATAAGVIVNVILVAVLLWWADGRVALVNWFFKLRGVSPS